MNRFKSMILDMVEKIEYGASDELCDHLQGKIPAFDVTSNTLDRGYKPTICFVTLLFSYLSSLLEHTCTLLVKGGRAVQLALSSKTRYNPLYTTEENKNIDNTRSQETYPSDDIDILIVPLSKDNRDAQLIALRIGEFIDWLTTKNTVTAHFENGKVKEVNDTHDFFH